MSQKIVVVVVVVLVLVLLLNMNKKDSYRYEDGYEYRNEFSSSMCKNCLEHTDDPSTCLTTCFSASFNIDCINCLEHSGGKKCILACDVRPKIWY